MDVLDQEQELLQRRIDAMRADLARLLEEAREMARALESLTGETTHDPGERKQVVVDESAGHVGEF